MEAIKSGSSTSFEVVSSSIEGDTAQYTEKGHDKPDIAIFTDYDIANEMQEFHSSQNFHVPETHDDDSKSNEIPTSDITPLQLQTACISEFKSLHTSEIQLANESIPQIEE